MRTLAVAGVAAAFTLLTVPAYAGVIGPGHHTWTPPVEAEPVAPVEAATDCSATELAAEQGLTPDALNLLRCVHQKWPDLDIGGVRPDSLPDHPSGRALDIMTPGTCSPVGQEIADWARQNAEQLGVDYVIWCSEIWSVQRGAEGWRPNSGHADHVHISVNA